MSNKSIDIEAVNSTVLTAETVKTQSTPNFSDAFYSLFLVLGFIIILALVVKKLGANTRFKKSKHLSVIDSISVGNKERIVIVQHNKTLLTLGVTANQVTLLDKTEIGTDQSLDESTPAEDTTPGENSFSDIGFKSLLDKFSKK